MPSTAEKWEATEEVIKDVPEVGDIVATPFGGERDDVVVDLETERRARAGQKIASEKAKADVEALTQKAILDSRRRIESADEPAVNHRKQWMEDAPSTPLKEPAGRMRTNTWVKNESRGFFAKLFNRKAK